MLICQKGFVPVYVPERQTVEYLCPILECLVQLIWYSRIPDPGLGQTPGVAI